MKIHLRASDAVAAVQSAHRVFVHGAAATPRVLIDALVAQAGRLRDVELIHLHTIGPTRYADPDMRQSFKVSAFFVGANLRAKIHPPYVDYIPCLLSEVPQLIRTGRVPIDVALIHVSPPDAHGYCTLGTSTDAARAAVDTASLIIAQINSRMPRMHGDGQVHISRIDHAIEIHEFLPEAVQSPPSLAELEIARLAAGIIDDGSTLQMGIGSIPDTILGGLRGHCHLGIHTEMWSDGALELLRCGAVDNSRKNLYPGKTVAGFVNGSQALYDFVHDNPSVVGLDISYVNRPENIGQNPKVVAINSAVEIDLTGQICADSIGSHILSGAGGQLDFVRGAALSPGGKSIIALTSRTRRGTPRIVPTLKLGGGVVTSRAESPLVITEYGIAQLHGRTLASRAHALIQVAHPDDREALERNWRALYSQ